jgi:ATP-binding cassette subfamily B protein
MFQRLKRLAAPRKWTLLVSAIFSILSSALSLAPYVLISILIALATSNDMPLGLRRDQMVDLALVFAFLVVLRYALFFSSLILSHMAAFDILYRLRSDICAHLGRLSMGYFGLRRSGEIKKVFAEDVDDLELFLAHHIPDLVAGVVQPLSVVICLFVFDWRLALVALIPLPLAFFLQRKAFGRDREKNYVKEYHDALENMNGSIIEYIRGMPVVKIFNQTTESFRALKSAALAYQNYSSKISRLMAPTWAMFVVTTTSGLFFILPFGLWFYSQGTLDFSTLMLFLMLCSAYMAPVFKLAMVGGQLRTLLEGLKRVDAILEEPPLRPADNPQECQSYTIKFNDVSFKYKTKLILDHVNFTLPQGGVYALVGPSGAGKSTLAKLIARMWDVNDGSITIGGVDLRDMSEGYLMERVAIAFQETFIISDTIRENIKMNSKASDDQILKAAEAAQCLDFLERLPKGLDTLIGEGGEVHLSGGERQRLSLARIYLKNAPIIILDEATVYNDAENESKIQKAFSLLMRDKTVIIIAHRLSTITDVDQILVIDNGRLVQKGLHDDLLFQDGLYKSLWTAHETALGWQL